MARMIPSVISPEVKSNAEKRIFKWFQEAPGTDDWVVLHSLGLAQHDTLLYGEIDFLVLAPRLGIFAMEVKGGRVKRVEGKWQFINRYGHIDEKKRGPFDQAKEGIHSLISALETKVDFEHRHIPKTMYSYGVMFPDIEYSSVGVEEAEWQVFDCNDKEDVVGFVKRLSKNSIIRWEETYGPYDKDKIVNADDVNYLAKLLRGDFDKAVAMSAKIRYAEQELIELTNRQYACIDQLEDNKRGVVRGPAGTGKTLIAVEEAKRMAVDGRRVALLCYNASLGKWFQSYFDTAPQEMKPEYVGTLHGLLMKVVEHAGKKITVPTDEAAKEEFYSTVLPNIAEEVLLSVPYEFDEIIIDEAQDLLNDKYLDLLDLLIVKGLERGKWKFFGDFSRQAIYSDGEDEESLLERLEDRTSFIKFKLVENCRNTKQICEDIQTITGFKAPSDLWSKVDGIPVEHEICDGDEAAVIKLEEIIDKLITKGIEKEKITILSPKRRQNSIVDRLDKFKVTEYSFSATKEITFSTIHSFKGLENTVIIITDIDTYSCDQLMYVGLSRARSALYLIENKNAHKEYNELLTRRLLNGR